MLNLTDKNLPQTEMTPFTYGFWRRVSGAGHSGSLTDFVAHYIKKTGSRTFDLSDTPRMNSRLHMGVPLPAQISEPCPEYLKCVMDVKNILRGLIALALVVNQDFVSKKARGIRDLYTLRIGKGKSIRPVEVDRPWRAQQDLKMAELLGYDSSYAAGYSLVLDLYHARPPITDSETRHKSPSRRLAAGNGSQGGCPRLIAPLQIH